ncbi:MAG TPA: SPFH domain-containing protein [Thermoanaerobaculia bacterium]|jgi:regulator of protease activity HflC (stomatin/prohibitin superfamily)|nr:SPFH domain-containing protein [Thermoanaerobaculia bacterium]
MFESATSAPRFRPSFPFKLPPLRGGLVRFLLRVGVLIVPLILLRACLITYVPLDQIGLRQVSFGMNKGLQKELVQPGYRRSISGYETIRTFPRNVQAVEFTNDEAEKGADHRTVAAINVPTVDGYPVAVDVTVLYRIADPFLVVSKFGFGRGYEDNVVMRFTDPAIKQHLGELRAEEFYRDQRIAKVHDLRKELADKFRQNGLELADVLIRQYDYPDTFQQLTEQKKIQDQSVLTNRALTKQAEVDTRLKQTAAEGQNSINVRSAEFQAQITGLNAQKDNYERSKHAEADLLVKSAEAQGTEEINRAMEGAGSDKLLRLRKGLAILNGIKGPIYISEDPTDIGKITGSGKH